MRYASNTSVSEERSRGEIERALIAYGASRFGYMRDGATASIGFTYRGVNIRMEIPLPSSEDDAFTKTPTGRRRRSNTTAMYEQEVRRRWRCLALAIKAKLVAVADGVASFEAEFLPYMIASDGQTIAQKMLPMVEAAANGTPIPSSLALPPGSDE